MSSVSFSTALHLIPLRQSLTDPGDSRTGRQAPAILFPVHTVLELQTQTQPMEGF